MLLLKGVVLPLDSNLYTYFFFSSFSPYFSHGGPENDLLSFVAMFDTGVQVLVSDGFLPHGLLVFWDQYQIWVGFVAFMFQLSPLSCIAPR